MISPPLEINQATQPTGEAIVEHQAAAAAAAVEGGGVRAQLRECTSQAVPAQSQLAASLYCCNCLQRICVAVE